MHLGSVLSWPFLSLQNGIQIRNTEKSHFGFWGEVTLVMGSKDTEPDSKELIFKSNSRFHLIKRVERMHLIWINTMKLDKSFKKIYLYL